MKADEKCIVAIDKGYTCDLESGVVYGPYGKVIDKTNSSGYINIFLNGIKKNLKVHQYIFYIGNGYVPKLIDHIDRDKTNNKLSNLREGNKSINSINRDSKGYTYVSCRNKYKAQINIDGKNTFIGHYNTKEEAHQAYLDAKKTHHQKYYG